MTPADVLHIAAFSHGLEGGNPAGVALPSQWPDAETMQRIAAAIGHSETVFAVPNGQSGQWRVRYFSPQSEVPFCGHATIALGAALHWRAGREGHSQCHDQAVDTMHFQLNHTRISVEASTTSGRTCVTLHSPPTHSQPATEAMVAEALALFGWNADVLDHRLPPARIHAGADHLVLALDTRARLAAMRYDFAQGARIMHARGYVTVMLVHWAAPDLFYARNAFAAGGVYEDPATGAAAAALGGYLRDSGHTPIGAFTIHQGDDMGVPCRIAVKLDGPNGGPITLSGEAAAWRKRPF